jgi:hypothetical protein
LRERGFGGGANLAREASRRLDHDIEKKLAPAGCQQGFLRFQLADRGDDAVARLRADMGPAVQGAVHCGRSEPRLTGDLLDGKAVGHFGISRGGSSTTIDAFLMSFGAFASAILA